MILNPTARACKHQPRGFESLEPRFALAGVALSLPTLGQRVYSAPIGPAPMFANPVAGAATAVTTLPPLTLNAASLLKSAGLPIGPTRPVTLPSQTPVSMATPLYAEGVLPTFHSTASLPTTLQSMPVIDSPGVPTFTLVPSHPLH